MKCSARGASFRSGARGSAQATRPEAPRPALGIGVASRRHWHCTALRQRSALAMASCSAAIRRTCVGRRPEMAQTLSSLMGLRHVRDYDANIYTRTRDETRRELALRCDTSPSQSASRQPVQSSAVQCRVACRFSSRVRASTRVECFCVTFAGLCISVSSLLIADAKAHLMLS